MIRVVKTKMENYFKKRKGGEDNSDFSGSPRKRREEKLGEKNSLKIFLTGENRNLYCFSLLSAGGVSAWGHFCRPNGGSRVE